FDQLIQHLKVIIVGSNAVQQRSQLAVGSEAEHVGLALEQLIVQSGSDLTGFNSGFLRLLGLLADGIAAASGQHADGHNTGQSQRSNLLEFHSEFSSLWCIKDRDPKQAERKVLFLSKAL